MLNLVVLKHVVQYCHVGSPRNDRTVRSTDLTTACPVQHAASKLCFL